MAEALPKTINEDNSTTTSTSATSDSPLNPPAIPLTFGFPSNLPTPPFIDVGGIANFRDLGGYLTASSYLSGAGIGSTKPVMFRRNLLYRCAHPQLLTSAGAETMKSKLGIREIFDFRSAPEVKKLSSSLPQYSASDAPTNPASHALAPPGINRNFTPVYEEEDYSPDVLAKKVGWYTAAETTPNSNAGSGSTQSLSFAYSPGFVSAYRDISLHACKPNSATPRYGAYPRVLRQLLSHPDVPILFHCTAGKDRTGILAAMLLRLVGVDDETIGWEYALTEPGLGSWRETFIKRISMTGLGGGGSEVKDGETNGGVNKANGNLHPASTSEEINKLTGSPKMTRAEAARIVGSRSGNIKAFLKIVVDGEFGGVERYLTDNCGLTIEEVQRLREILTVPVTEENARTVVMPRSIKGWTPEGGVQDHVEGKVGENSVLGMNENAGRETEERVMTG